MSSPANRTALREEENRPAPPSQQVIASAATGPTPYRRAASTFAPARCRAASRSWWRSAPARASMAASMSRAVATCSCPAGDRCAAAAAAARPGPARCAARPRPAAGRPGGRTPRPLRLGGVLAPQVVVGLQQRPGLQDLRRRDPAFGSRPFGQQLRRCRASVLSVLACRLRPRAAAVSAGSPRCAATPAAASSSLSRPGARFQRCRWPVSPGRSPNPPCESSAQRALHGSRRQACSGRGPGAGDLATAVAVPGDRYRVDPPQLGLPAGDRQPPPCGGGVPSTELLPSPVVPLHQHAGHPSPGVVIQHAEGLFRDRVPEVSGPAVHDQVEPGQHVSQVLLRCPAGQGTDLGLQRPDGPVGDEGIDVPLVCPSLALPLDAEAEEVEPLAHVHHPGLGW